MLSCVQFCCVELRYVESSCVWLSCVELCCVELRSVELSCVGFSCVELCCVESRSDDTSDPVVPRMYIFFIYIVKHFLLAIDITNNDENTHRFNCFYTSGTI